MKLISDKVNTACILLNSYEGDNIYRLATGIDPKDIIMFLYDNAYSYIKDLIEERGDTSVTDVHEAILNLSLVMVEDTTLTYIRYREGVFVSMLVMVEGMSLHRPNLLGSYLNWNISTGYGRYIRSVLADIKSKGYKHLSMTKYISPKVYQNKFIDL